MILGLSMSSFTWLHVVISLVGIVSGFVVLAGMLRGELLGSWTALFLLTTVLTSVTGFMFPISGMTPALVVGAVSLVVLVIALLGRYAFHLGGSWRWIYVVTALAALYLNTFVLVVQAFRKVPSLHGLAPTESEPPFAIAQAALLVLFLIFGFLAVRRFRPGPKMAA